MIDGTSPSSGNLPKPAQIARSIRRRFLLVSICSSETVEFMDEPSGWVSR